MINRRIDETVIGRRIAPPGDEAGRNLARRGRGLAGGVSCHVCGLQLTGDGRAMARRRAFAHGICSPGNAFTASPSTASLGPTVNPLTAVRDSSEMAVNGGRWGPLDSISFCHKL